MVNSDNLTGIAQLGDVVEHADATLGSIANAAGSRWRVTINALTVMWPSWERNRQDL